MSSPYSRHSLRCATNQDGVWTVEDIASSGPAHSLAVTASGAAHVGHAVATLYLPDTNVMYATNASGEWATETVDSNGPVGRGVAIALNSGGAPHFSCFDELHRDIRYVGAISPLDGIDNDCDGVTW